MSLSVSNNWKRECIKAVTQEFHLLVTPISPDRYLVRTEQVALGVPLAEEQVEWPVDHWLTQARQVFENPLGETFLNNGNGSLERSPQADDPTLALNPPPNLVAFGQALYNALFQGTVLESWRIAQGIAQHRGKVLRLRLGFKGGSGNLADYAARLQHLPWEILHDGTRPLATGKDLIFSRYQPQFASLTANRPFPTATSSLPRTLRILMVLAGPSDQTNLALKQEALHLQEELTHHGLENGEETIPNIQLTILEQPGREKLTQTLEQGKYQVFHFAGHSNQGPSGGQLHLVNARTGLTESLTGDDLAGLLVNNGIWLAVLNSCLGTQAATSIYFQGGGDHRSLAAALIHQGIPSVLAMAERIPDRVALTLSRLFYRNLKFGYSIDLSLCRARQGLISAYGSHQLYWALPVLHLHAEFEGQLVFTPEPGATSQEVEESEPEAFFPSEVSSLAPDLPAIPLYEETTLHEDQEGGLASLIHRLSNLNPEEEETPLKAAHEELLLPEVEQSLELYPDLPLSSSQAWPASQGVSRGALATVANSSLAAQGVYGEGELGNAHATIALYRETIALNPTDYKTYFNLGQALLEEGQLMEAIDAYHQTLSLNPNCAEAYSGLGQALAEQGNYGNAIVAYRQAIALNPHLPDTYQHLRDALAQQAPSRRPILADPVEIVPASNDEGVSVEPVSGPLMPKEVKTFLGSLPLWTWLGLTGIVATVTLTLLIFTGPDAVKLKLFSTASDPKPSLPETNRPNPLGRAETAAVTAQAIRAFTDGNVSVGEGAVEALLDRSALREAQAALGTAVEKQVHSPNVLFLQGRLAWQAVQTGDSDFSVEDARRFWETATQGQPLSPLHLNALAFAYYAEGNLTEAKQAWRKVLGLDSGADPGQVLQDETGNVNPDRLTAYAGIALTLLKAAQAQPPAQQAQFLNQASTVYAEILQRDPTGFTSASLSQNWLWTEGAIEDWQLLGKLSGNLP
jgi:tetratricopeptide (TPR) repeat protein